MGHRLLLRGLGARIRALRAERGWSRRELATRAELSERFLAQVESGDGNPSILSLAQIAAAIGSSPAALLAGPTKSSMVALLGLRGAGKSTVGRALGGRLEAPFVELDARIEDAAGLSLREIFELHGEDYYRRVEREVLERVLGESDRMVLAAGGGLVTHPQTFERLKQSSVTVWLRATPEDHWARVVAQGDHRPMANDPLAMAHLRTLLAEREDLYRTADHIVDTSGAEVDDIVGEIAGLVAG